ncbi:TonB-dependent receptor [Seonamhaeicola maritimus]|uniref:TonB-dependent receptor n=1 Tax=Seonamhaeicola maritimus TaxID=2591822 RepID=A0A5C7GMN4_9FLAO|nr:TonB-dependent receptor plug domain-containing protein [Seonamhaeicola maritimus]TXG39337.1 TonB-dependent receptor [Seonamhaeicola maritimus]
MIKKTNQIIILFSFILLALFNVSAQEKNKKQSLASVIHTLQNKFNVKFNYAEDIIEDVFLIAPEDHLTLPEVLKHLESNTTLLYTRLDNIVIIKLKKEGVVKICGYLKDRESLQPLSFTIVQSGNNRTTTDKAGYFQIELTNLELPVRISHLGYKTIEKPYNEFVLNTCEDIYLVHEFQSLSEVVISNYIATGINKISDGSYEIDYSKFDILPGLIDNDVLHSVQAFPGIISANETVSNINIRGGTHDQNLILWDGIKMYQSGHFFGLISMYNPHITQKSFLRKNGSDVSYTDGVSGTIMMETENKVNDNFKGVVDANLTNVNAFADVPIGHKSSLQLATRKSINQFVETPTYNSFFERISQNTEVASNANAISNTNEAFDFYDISLRWIYKINDNEELRLNFINANNRLQFNENAVVNNQAESKRSTLTQNSIAGGLNYKKYWSNKLNTTFEIYETDYKLRSLNSNVLESQRFLQENVVSETSSKIKLNYHPTNDLNFLLGYHFVETEVSNLDDMDNPIYRLLVSEVLRTHGVFSQVNYKSKNGTTNVNFGLRYNYISKFKKSFLEPRFSFMQRFSDHFTFEMLGEFKNQNTSQVINFQSDFLGIEKRRWQLSNNLDIPILTSKQVSAGLNYNHNNWLLSVKGYLKKVEGITSQSQGFQNQYEFVKSKGSYNAHGLDVLLRKQISNFNLWLSYTHLSSDYTFKDLEPHAFPSNYDITHALTFGTTYSNKRIKVSGGLNWHSGKPVTCPIQDDKIVNGNINFGPTNEETLKDYLRLDISALYNFSLNKKSKVKVGLSLWNVLNRKNELNNFYSINLDNLNETIQQSLGFTPNAVVRVHF